VEPVAEPVVAGCADGGAEVVAAGLTAVDGVEVTRCNPTGASGVGPLIGAPSGVRRGAGQAPGKFLRKQVHPDRGAVRKRG
jgi:hypothetical protein